MTGMGFSQDQLLVVAFSQAISSPSCFIDTSDTIFKSYIS